MDKDTRLVYLSSDSIVAFCNANPIWWGEDRDANKAGNWYIEPPAMAIFFGCLTVHGGLFSQQDYVNYAGAVPVRVNIPGLGDNLSFPELAEGHSLPLRTRLCRNFYVSAIDSLHVWALLVESGEFDRCFLDTADDVVGKTDLSVWRRDGQYFRINLAVGSHRAKQWAEHKRLFRGECNEGLRIELPCRLPKQQPSNKRWYRLEDFAVLFDRQPESPARSKTQCDGQRTESSAG